VSIALRGNLQDFGIAEVFQLIGQQQKTGLLEVSAGGQTVRLAFDAGGIVWARPVGAREDGVLGERLVRSGLLSQPKLDALYRESESSARPLAALAVDSDAVSEADVQQIENLITNDTIFTVLRWSQGSFDFSPQAIHHKRPKEKLLAAEQILMDGLRMVDEWSAFAARVPSGGTVFQRCGQIESFRQQSSGQSTAEGHRVEKVFALVDGQLSVDRIVDLSRLGLFDATRALAELRHLELIEPLSGRQARAGRRTAESPRRRVVDRARWWLAAAFPLAVLSLVVSMIFNLAPAGDPEGVFPIERYPLERARAVFEKARLRHALEAQKMLTGRWPGSLDEAGRAGVLGSAALTPAGADDYYYVRRGSGILLLAPER
jgi:hypothetical protein